MATTWINTADRLPAINQNEESDWVLVRLATGAVYVAQLRESVWGADDIRTEWIERGQDGYELTNVEAWTEIPA